MGKGIFRNAGSIVDDSDLQLIADASGLQGDAAAGAGVFCGVGEKIVQDPDHFLDINRNLTGKILRKIQYHVMIVIAFV